MQTVPSLVGTGTAIAAAASGLVFGQPFEPETSSIASSNRRRTHKRRSSNVEQSFHTHTSHFNSTRPTTTDYTSYDNELYYTTHSRPSSSSRPPLTRHQRPRSRQFPPLRLSTSRRSSSIKRGEPSTPVITQDSGAPASSNGSWIRRLSLRRPLSYHESSRPSTCADSPSIFSHGSSAPILSPTSSTAPRPPKKLVKRAPPGLRESASDEKAAPRRGIKSHLPPLRRPATSHQRSATLQQMNPPSDATTPISLQNFSFDQEPRPRYSRTPSPFMPSPLESEEPASRPSTRSGWSSFFHSRRGSFSLRPASSRLSELKPVSRSLGGKRIHLGFGEKREVHLIKPRMVSSASAPPVLSSQPAQITEQTARPSVSTESIDERSTENQTESFTDEDYQKKTKRSLSISLTSAANIMSKTAGSLRRSKRLAEAKEDGNKRRVSEPGSTTLGVQPTADVGANTTLEAGINQERQGSALDSAAHAHLRTRKRTSSSPLPPLSGLSSFNVDLSRLGSPSGVSNLQVRQNQPSGSSTSSTGMLQQFRAAHHERSSTMESSEGDTRDCTDDDTDFKSDTMFDSYRTNRARTVETPLDSLYDESPPSTAGHGKSKRISIQEMLNQTWEEEQNRIMEEDENMPTPVRTIRRVEGSLATRGTRSGTRFSIDYNDDVSPTQNPDRPSLDDDFDDDWARDDDDAPCNPLSPPSKGNSLNSKLISPNVRLALAGINSHAALNVPPPLDTPMSERPMSTLFDWSEPPNYEKTYPEGRTLRPKTSYVKPDTDNRGGRLQHRKGPVPLHVRSQSMPVVHGFNEQTKATGSKYSTWGIAAKPVSEDWDDDFEFGGSNIGSDREETKVFAVPESIQATQPSVKAHSGQIREFSLLVNDLKRLCRHGRDMDMLNGSSRVLWNEAEGIIALASPDEDSEDSDDSSDSCSVDFDAFDVDERSDDGGFSTAPLERLDDPFDGYEPAMSKTAVVRERYSPRRRSVFSPEDDIFGNFQLSESNNELNRSSRPKTPEGRSHKPNDVNGVVRSVMEAMHQRNASEPPQNLIQKGGKMHFDTNSLKALVKRAGELRDALSNVIRRADQITPSPAGTPRLERQPDSSPAFIKVFDEPGSSPPRRMHRSRDSTSMMERPSPERSPSSRLPQRMQMMTVS